LRLRQLASEEAMGSDILLDATMVKSLDLRDDMTGGNPHDG
jgi:hypothetical protein